MKLISWKLRLKDTYIHLLTVLVLLFLLAPLIPHTRNGSTIPILPLIFLAAVIFTLRTLNLPRRIFLFALSVGLAWYLCELLMDFFVIGAFKENFRLVSVTMYCVFLLISIVLMAHKMFLVSEVTADTVMGGISVYMLLGFLWAMFYNLIFMMDPNAFHFSGVPNRGSLFYFSFVVLTSVGFGDIYPVNKLAMSLANLEAVAGQMYVAIFISRLVSLHLVHKSRK